MAAIMSNAELDELHELVVALRHKYGDLTPDERRANIHKIPPRLAELLARVAQFTTTKHAKDLREDGVAAATAQLLFVVWGCQPQLQLPRHF